jgi:hypothetical protein
MARRRRPLRRLDLLCIGASPDKLQEQTEIPAAAPGSLTAEQSKRLYILRHRNEADLQPWERLELERLRRLY